jgi:tetratricopeptide (TPR) repeat protein
MGQSLRLRRISLAVAAVIPVAAGIALVVAGILQPRPTFEQVSELARSKRFDEALTQGNAYLRLFPRDPQALLVMAEIELSRPEPEPERALEFLERIKADTPSLAAWVLVDRGNADYLLARFDQSEACWREALKRDPTVLEAGRRLLDLLGLQGRFDEARTLALRQFKNETDQRERLRLLLRLTQLDVDPPDPWLVVKTFEPAALANSANLSTTLACGMALVTVSRSHEGLPMLRRAVDRNPDSPRAWDALLTGLETAAGRDEVVREVARMPQGFAAEPRFAKHQGWLQQELGHWHEAARAYEQAWNFEPDNAIGYRLCRTLRLAGQGALADRFDRLVLDYRDAFKQARGLLDQANAAIKDGSPIDMATYALMAGLRERMRRTEEAQAWRRLVVLLSPGHSSFFICESPLLASTILKRPESGSADPGALAGLDTAGVLQPCTPFRTEPWVNCHGT